MVAALIGNGVIGSVLQESIKFDFVFNSKNIREIQNHKYDIVYCAAPSSNRLQANADPGVDLNNIFNLIETIKTIVTKEFILISTVDTQIKNTPYAKNRYLLEQCVLEMHNSRIVRLCSLVGKQIKKNILYDLKHGQYITNINLNDVYQWYPLNNLEKDISYNSTRIMNLVSEPIKNQLIIEKFYPEYFTQVKDKKYSHYDIQPYVYTCDDIMIEIRKYCEN